MSIIRDKHGNLRAWLELVQFIGFIGIIVGAAMLAVVLFGIVAVPLDKMQCNQRKEEIPQAGYVYRFPAGCLATNPDYIVVGS